MLKTTQNTIKIISPAKVNLFLAVGKKEDDYHPVLNVLHTLLLHDVIYINYEKSNQLSINIEFLENEDSDGEIPNIALEDNLIYQAIYELSKKTARHNYKIDVYVEKNIPMQAGLAGGSSNAAAALVGASKIFGISDEDTIINVAQKIGSDVAFFLSGGCALYKGKGDVLDHKISPINREVVLVKPFNDKGLSTKDVYAEFDHMNLASNLEAPYPTDDCDCGHDHHDEMSLTQATSQLQYADNIPLFNNLAAASENLCSDLVEVKKWLMEKCGNENVLLCGSGSATFAIVPDSQDSATIEAEAKAKGY